MNHLENKSYLSVGLAIGMAGITILAALIFLPLTFVLPKYIGDELFQLIYYILVTGTSFFIVYLIRKKKTNEKSFAVSFPHIYIIPFLIMGSLALLFGIIFPLTELIPVPEFLKASFESMGKQKGIASFFLMVVIAPVLEELMYRGIILDGLLRRYSGVTAILVSSILFGIVHLNPWQFIPAFFVGVFSGWAYYKTRNLILTILIHSTINFVGYMERIFWTTFSQYENPVELYGGFIQYISIILICILLFVVCVLCLRKLFNKQNNLIRKKEFENN
ncbi:MAG: type II CAAX endopeptidase family protein [Bacteroidales bacterium]|jgi:hypothetical protein|nr:type II CAAX endopeptidase family protein [Bacteroidales bacterium]MDD3939793.1 type II CAAX endopeptidase family protein [Patescibacteria group bacterium]